MLQKFQILKSFSHLFIAKKIKYINLAVNRIYMRVAVIIPVYNEERISRENAIKLFKFLDNKIKDYKIIILVSELVAYQTHSDNMWSL